MTAAVIHLNEDFNTVKEDFRSLCRTWGSELQNRKIRTEIRLKSRDLQDA